MKRNRNSNQTRDRALLALAGISVGLVTWRLYRHLSIPTQSTEIDLAFTTASPHLLSAAVFRGERPLQLLQDGIGALFHRRYYVDIANSTFTKTELMREIRQHLNTFSPNEMAIFQKQTDADDDEDAEMEVGDDYQIYIAGPWNGPVRVLEVTPTSFSFITLEGHFEAGEIQFHVIDHPELDNVLRFEIRSWARSRDRLVNLLYDGLGMMKTAQTQMWVYFCQRVVEVSGGELVDDVHVLTHRVPPRYLRRQLTGDLARWQQYRPRIEALRRAPLNFDLDRQDEFTEVNGWRLDAHTADLPPEAPGAPQPHGAWEQARQVLLNYEFPDPDLITGIFIPDDPLHDRVMLLEARFLKLTFRFGVMVSAVIDEERADEEQGRAQVWGYSYRTLQGHFEMGEITFEVWKFFDSGAVEFRIHSYSKTGKIANPLYRIGFALFGRGLQARFADTALERMQQLVTNRLAGAADQTETPMVKPLSEAHEN